MKIAVQELVARDSSIKNLTENNDESPMNIMLAPKDLNTVIQAKVRVGFVLMLKTYFAIIPCKTVV